MDGGVTQPSPQTTEESRSSSYWTAGLGGISAAFLFAGYELVRSPSNTLFKAAYGKEGLPYVMAATPVAVLLMLYVYGRLLTRLGPRRTLVTTTLASCALIAGSYGAIALKWKFASVILYITREAYIVLLMEQYWSFLNSTLGDANARRLNGPVCGIGSAGSIVGTMLVGSLAQPLGTAALVLLGAVITLPTALFGYLAYRHAGEPQPAPQEPRSDSLGARLFTREPVLVILLIVILLTQAISGLTDLSFQGMLQDRMPNADAQTAFSGWFFMWLSIFAAAMQFAVTPLLLWLVPLRWVHRVIPLVHVGTCLYLWRSPTLFSAGMAYMVFKVIDYSTFRAAKELLYIPLSFDSRYRAKEFIDVFGYRFGKGGISLVVILLQRSRIFVAEPSLGLISAGAAAIWAICAIPLVRRRSSTPAAPGLSKTAD